ncbi:MAG: acetyl-CoA carboxylase biotin carboxyl carrier protein [Nitrospira sp.]|nr:acetyl-CoA carboxylase biotin carboxyl carrier protein [Nitrospira sp.]
MSRRQPAEDTDQTGEARLLTVEHLRQVQDLITLLRKNNLTELEIEQQGFRVRLRYEVGVRPATGSLTDTAVVPPQGNQSLVKEATPSEEDTSGLVTITSPIVGTFYRSPSPDADPYVEEGDYVKKGQVLCIVEAMKLMNEIESETDGRIVKILAESTKPVEYGQPLFLIDPKARA